LPIKRQIKKFYHVKYDNYNETTASSQEYWTKVNVTNHARFISPEESKQNFEWRSRQYLGYLELMPVNDAGDKVVLDYGCGPGHDTVGFLVYSDPPPSKLISVDVSSTSLAEARARVALHPSHTTVDFVLIDENDRRLPFDDESIDIIHSSGVLHHIKDHKNILGEFKRILKPDGYAQIMVYNYDSIFMHLYTSYIVNLKEFRFENLNKKDRFAKLTDGPSCPIADCYRPSEYVVFVESIEGLKCECTGVAISCDEMFWLPIRFEALRNKQLDAESRNFLYNLTFNDRGLPVYNGYVAGVDACYRITKKR
jgi:ubiquinone/menaquinone biosynthesis C-methylase UbiE